MLTRAVGLRECGGPVSVVGALEDCGMCQCRSMYHAPPLIIKHIYDGWPQGANGAIESLNGANPNAIDRLQVPARFGGAPSINRSRPWGAWSLRC